MPKIEVNFKLENPESCEGCLMNYDTISCKMGFWGDGMADYYNPNSQRFNPTSEHELEDEQRPQECIDKYGE